MTTVRATIAAPVRAVWEELIDVRSYPTWLVGARKIRRVDDDWPAPGTAFHHEVGLFWPLKIADRTRCDDVDPPRRLVLDVRARPLVHGKVTFELSPGPEGTELTMEEHPIGVYRLFSPVISPATLARNQASLIALTERIQGRSTQHQAEA